MKHHGAITFTGLVVPGGAIEILFRVTSFDLRCWAFVVAKHGTALLKTVSFEDFVPYKDALWRLKYERDRLLGVYTPEVANPFNEVIACLEAAALQDLLIPEEPTIGYPRFAEQYQGHPAYTAQVTLQGHVVRPLGPDRTRKSISILVRTLE